MIKISLKLAFQGFVKSIFSRSFILLTTSFILLICALLMLLMFSFSSAIKDVKASYFITAYVQPTVSSEKESEIEENIKKLSGITNVQRIGKEQFVENFSKFFPQLLKNLNTVDADTIPRYFKIRIISEDAETIKSEILKIAGIESVDLQKNRFKGMIESLNLMKNFVFLLFLGSVMALLCILFNHYKLDEMSRIKTTKTFEMLGASTLQMTTPLLVEGLIEGFISGLIAVILLLITSSAFSNKVSHYFISLGYGFQMASLFEISVLLVIVGILAGFIGSGWASISMRVRR